MGKRRAKKILFLFVVEHECLGGKGKINVYRI
jgi:hypothetical protein